MTDLLETVRFFRHAFEGSLLVALVCAVVGVHVVGRRMVLVGVALPQVAAAGIGLSFLAGGFAWTEAGTLLSFTRRHDLMAVLACVAGALLLMDRPGRRRLPGEVITGAAFCAGGAGSLLFVLGTAQGMDEVRNLVSGDVLGIHGEAFRGLLLWLVPVLALHALAFRRFLFTSVDPEMAATLGIRTRAWDLLFYGSLAVVVARSVHATGMLFVFAFLVLPPATGFLLARRAGAVFAVAAGAALLAAGAGFLAAADPRLDWPVGPTATAAALLLFLAAAGWRRLRPAVT